MKYTIAIALLILATACTGTMTGQAIKDAEVVVGFTTPLTGDGAEWGVGVQKGALLAYEELQAEDTRLRIIFEDTRCEPKEAVTVTQKLLMINGASIITGEVCSSDALAQIPIVEAQEKLYLGTGVSNPDITETGAFRIWPSDAYKGSVIAERMLADGIRSTAVVVIGNDFGSGIETVFTPTFEQRGDVLLVERFEPGTKDFATILTKVKESRAEAMYVVLYPQEGLQFYQQLKELDLPHKIYADGDFFIAEGVLEKLNYLADGTTYVLNELPIDTAFVQRYEDRFGEAGGLLGALGYDSVMLIDTIVDACGDDVACMETTLHAIEYQGASGRIVFDENGDVLKGTSFHRIVNGKATQIA